MNQRNKKHSLWYSLGLGVLLCIAVLVVSTGTTYARYRTERTRKVGFAAREPERIIVGQYHTVTQEEAEADSSLKEGDVVFRQQEHLECEVVDGTPRIQLEIRNGTETEFSQRDQMVQLRLLGSLGLWTGEKPVDIYLAIEEPTVMEPLLAVPISIEKGTPLGYTYGEGWVYTFQSEDGELCWELPGGAFSVIKMTITMDSVPSLDEAKLNPQIVSWVIED